MKTKDFIDKKLKKFLFTNEPSFKKLSFQCFYIESPVSLNSSVDQLEWLMCIQEEKTWEHKSDTMTSV